MPEVVQIRRQPGVHLARRKAMVSCVDCNLRESCLSGGVPDEDLGQVENIVYARRRILRGQRLFSAGDPFRCIYAIREGFFKTSLADNGGRDQVTGFFMAGELLGLDGMGNGRCESTAIALEDSDVCAMPFSLIEEIARDVPSLQQRLHSVLAREIVHKNGIMLLLGSMCARERLAAFLLNLSRRLAHHGRDGADFVLRMTREEIGSYLGLKLETVSRLLSAFDRAGLIKVQQKHVSIVDSAGLERVLEFARVN